MRCRTGTHPRQGRACFPAVALAKAGPGTPPKQNGGRNPAVLFSESSLRAANLGRERRLGCCAIATNTCYHYSIVKNARPPANLFLMPFSPLGSLRELLSGFQPSHFSKVHILLSLGIGL